MVITFYFIHFIFYFYFYKNIELFSNCTVQKQLLDESLNGLRQYKHKCLGSITVKILNLVESLKENKEILDSRHLHKIESLKDADWAIKNEVGDVRFQSSYK